MHSKTEKWKCSLEEILWAFALQRSIVHRSPCRKLCLHSVMQIRSTLKALRKSLNEMSSKTEAVNELLPKILR
jgi:hypothetical protein